jgi:type IV secretory pathway VirJ component
MSRVMLVLPLLGLFWACPAAAAETGPETFLVDVADLPLVEVRAERSRGDAFAVFLSGDGGWAGFDQGVSAELAARGLPVTGLNSMSYFWTEVEPGRAAGDLERIIRHYALAWSAPRVVLIGYSQGADVLPFMVSRLPGGVRRSVALVALLEPGLGAEFEIHVSNWVADDPTAGRPIGPELARLAGTPVLCLYGTDNERTVCRQLPSGPEHGSAKAVAMEDGHHFAGRYGDVAGAVLDALAASGQGPGGGAGQAVGWVGH